MQDCLESCSCLHSKLAKKTIKQIRKTQIRLIRTKELKYQAKKGHNGLKISPHIRYQVSLYVALQEKMAHATFTNRNHARTNVPS